MKIEYHNIPALCEYIETQKVHHEKESYEEEQVLGYSGCFVDESGRDQVYFDAVALSE